ncbi:MAG: UvrD-helicase domain-containing protein [Rikenellaceae bacterium]|nr:UvrD-helicase domain-containing protein [Rikenellaceae bacterium]
MSQYLDNLNDVQREAAMKIEGPSLIVAGAGSGKTRVLTYRIAHMLETGIRSYNILALTFTNKAAREMKERINNIVSPDKTRYLWMGTFHSVFARILRGEADKLGYPQTFTIYDTADSRNVIRAIIKEMNLNEDYYKPNDIYSRISLAKNNLITADSYESNAVLVAEDRERRRPQFAEIYKKYTRKCREYGAMNFDDLLLNMNILFRDFPDVLEHYRNVFRYVLVDEYQDTNMAQYLIIKKIAEGHKNICVVGDDAQSIYSFRGAKIENILRFQKDYPEARLFKLEQNYRSTQNIVNAANSIIEKNKRQIKKRSFSSNEEGDKIRIFKAFTDKEEAMIVAGNIQSLIYENKAAYGDIAVLYRTNAQSRALEESLRRRNIPYRIYGGQSFYQRKEIKDILAYIRLIVNSKDDEALRRIINYPARGIGDVTIGKIAEAAVQHGLSMWDVVSMVAPEQMGLRGGAVKKIKDFTEMIGQLRNKVAVTPAYELGFEIASRSGIIGTFKMQQTPESISVLENIDELLNSIASFVESVKAEDPDRDLVTIDEWLQNVALLTDMDTETADGSHVTLMTVHSAKGLEFGHVHIVGMEENLFPSQMCSDSLEGLEEERRLFYVALTRAKQAAYLTFSDTRFRWGNVTSNRPSRFLGNISPEYMELMFDPEERERTDGPDSLGNVSIERKRFERTSVKSAAAQNPVKTTVLTDKFRSIGKRPSDNNSDSEVKSSGTIDDITVGAVVSHDKFGKGVVSELENTQNGLKVKVDFSDAGSKTLLLKYAKLTVIKS